MLVTIRTTKSNHKRGTSDSKEVHYVVKNYNEALVLFWDKILIIGKEYKQEEYVKKVKFTLKVNSEQVESVTIRGYNKTKRSQTYGRDKEVSI